ARVAPPELGRVGAQPVGERDVRLGVGRQPLTGTPFLDTAVPWANVLADVATVDLRAKVTAVLERRRFRRLRPVGEAPRRVEHAGLVERVRRARIDAEPALAAVGVERWRRLQL